MKNKKEILFLNFNLNLSDFFVALFFEKKYNYNKLIMNNLPSLWQIFVAILTIVIIISIIKFLFFRKK